MNWETDLPRVELVRGRQQEVLQRCVGKRVLHLGCVDTGLLEERFAQGQLMHQKLARAATDLWGVDVNRDGIEFLRSHGFEQVVTADATRPVPALDGHVFDVVVATEVVEHLQNPGLFLDTVRSWMVPGRTELVITVPNAFRVDTLLALFRRVERVHPDHNYWFSYRTATNLLRKAGYQILDIKMYSLQPHGLLPDRLGRRSLPAGANQPELPPEALPPLRARAGAYFRTFPRRLLNTALYAITPFWGDGLILVARVPA